MSPQWPTPLIFSFNVDSATLENAGGKGMNLARLTQAGFAVPSGFIVSTAAYHAFVQANVLDETIACALAGISAADPSTLDVASHTIQTAFAAGALPEDVIVAVRDAYIQLSFSCAGNPGSEIGENVPVAVRSSATAEDLPGFSFAGQQDTFLNIIGIDALKKAVLACWSSLWTARAIGYRSRNAIPHAEVAIAVVVQQMVPSEASGVLFTANPLTGKRDEAVIDATLGLGEALVSGQVEPDHYVLDMTSGRILEHTLGTKAVAIYGQAEGGTTTRDIAASDRPALADVHLRALARIGKEVEALFGAPQDIEWAFANGHLYLLQTRPITTLYPLPIGLPTDPLSVMLSFGSVQGMLDPITPLGRDAIAGLVEGSARLFGYHFTVETQSILLEAGARFWVKLHPLLNNHLGRRITLGALEYVDPATKQIVQSLLETENWPAQGFPRLRTLLHIARPLPVTIGRALRTLLHPDAQREALLHRLETWFARCAPPDVTPHSLSAHAAWMRQVITDTFPVIIAHFVPRFGMGMATYNLLIYLANSNPDVDVDPRILLRGVPHNVTTEMDLCLWQTAQTIRADAQASTHCTSHNPATLAAEFAVGNLPPVAQEAIAQFLHRYGMRGLGEIDLGRPRWRDDPTPLLQVLQSYLHINDLEMTPNAVFAHGRQTAEACVERLVASLQQTRGGWFKARLVRWAARRMRALVGLRETPKFYIIRLFSRLRDILLADGEVLAAAGILEQPDDVFFLHLAELEALESQPDRDWRALVRARRQINAQEQRRRQVPRLLLSDGRAFYEGLAGSSEDALVGNPVSPGMVEGMVRVVLDPRGVQLTPGDILVCPGTDPAWTPLFLAAGGLVMEVGGMMTHGAVVAREYGLPAVVGVHEATQRLKTGQRVRVDGTSGRVVLLE